MSASAVGDRPFDLVRSDPAGRLRAWIGPRTLVIGATFMILLGLAVRPMTDGDFWWHITTGRWILDHHALPTRDLYTFTATGHQWVDHEWLTEVLLWLAYQATGLALLSVVFGVLVVAGMVLLYLAADGPSRPPIVAASVLAMATLAGTAVWSPRTQVITFTFSCLVVYWIERYLSGRGRSIRALPLLVAVWANLHSGFVIAFAFVGVVAASEGVHWLAARRGRSETAGIHLARVKELAIIGVVSALAVLATPNGIRLWLYPFLTQASAAQQDLIDEWLSPNFHIWSMKLLEVMILAVVVGFAIRRPRLHELLLCVLTLALTLQSARHLVFFIAVATPVLMASYSDGWYRLFGEPARGPARSTTVAILNAAILAVVGGAVAFHGYQALASQPAFSRATFPVGATAYLRAHPAIGHRIFDEYSYGGYLIYAYDGDGGRHVFVFSEGSVMGDQLLYEYVGVQSLKPGWSSVLDRYQVDTVMIKPASPLSAYLATDPGWRQVYSDGGTVIFARDV